MRLRSVFVLAACVATVFADAGTPVDVQVDVEVEAAPEAAAPIPAPSESESGSDIVGFAIEAQKRAFTRVGDVLQEVFAAGNGTYTKVKDLVAGVAGLGMSAVDEIGSAVSGILPDAIKDKGDTIAVGGSVVLFALFLSNNTDQLQSAVQAMLWGLLHVLLMLLLRLLAPEAGKSLVGDPLFSFAMLSNKCALVCLLYGLFRSGRLEQWQVVAMGTAAGCMVLALGDTRALLDSTRLGQAGVGLGFFLCDLVAFSMLLLQGIDFTSPAPTAKTVHATPAPHFGVPASRAHAPAPAMASPRSPPRVISPRTTTGGSPTRTASPNRMLSPEMQRAYNRFKF
eukprot:comp20965_c0_seq1/m.28053 comp20965_c0_seq1/g.28053  ORF comp20965_c0_seq1/g.28053 comp20965_c0_seq1/m.28053 type:complete len:339 (-) comp20965_c0_seq1:171-1187(-)